MRSERVPVALSPCFHFPAGRLSGLGGGAVTAHNVADLFPTLQHHIKRPADEHGGAPLVLRQYRQTGVLFTGCSAYPGCAFTEPHDPRVQTLSTGVVQALHTLATQVAQVQTAAQQQLAQAQVEAQRQAAERATLDHTVRQLIALAHPDRWPDTPLAHELTVATEADSQPEQSQDTRSAYTAFQEQAVHNGL